jgi:hypothetical protein
MISNLPLLHKEAIILASSLQRMTSILESFRKLNAQIPDVYSATMPIPLTVSNATS